MLAVESTLPDAFNESDFEILQAAANQASIAIARARLLVERNGGKLMTRDDADGTYVQVTMPRRVQKGAFGQA